MTSLPSPNWWQFALLALAAFRVYRLIARDTITEPVREAITYRDDREVALGDELADKLKERGIEVVGDDRPTKGWRVYLSTLIRCPWCAGFYVSVAWWASWSEWPRPTLFAAVPWAVSAVVAMLAKNLDA